MEWLKALVLSSLEICREIHFKYLKANVANWDLGLRGGEAGGDPGFQAAGIPNCRDCFPMVQNNRPRSAK